MALLRQRIHAAEPVRIHVLGVLRENRHLLALLLIGIVPLLPLGDELLLGKRLLLRRCVLLRRRLPGLLLTHEPEPDGQGVQNHHAADGGDHAVAT